MQIDLDDVAMSFELDDDFIVDTILQSDEFGKAIQEVVKYELDYEELAEKVKEYADLDDDVEGRLMLKLLEEKGILLETIRDSNRRLTLLERPLWKKIYGWLKRIG